MSDVQTVSFLDVSFSVAQGDVWRQKILTHGRDRPFGYIVTPNVDHVIRLSREAALRPIYAAATARICDSRVLQHLARIKGHELQVYPGSDIVRDIFNDPQAKALRIAACGPSAEDFAILQANCPDLNLIWIDAPFMKVDDENWTRVLADVEAADCDIVLLCLSFPKQEIMAAHLHRRGKAVGMGLCVGASLDFLTGRQRRAPELMQKLSLEWLYRLGSDPARLWKRYLLEGPKVFWLFLTREVGRKAR